MRANMRHPITLSEKSIGALAKIVCGNPRDNGEKIAPYRSGPQLFEFFKAFGASDVYRFGGGMPSREPYTRDRLREHNGETSMHALIEAALDPRHFLDTEFSIASAVEWLNQYLLLDGVELRSKGRGYRAHFLGSQTVEITAPVTIEPASHEYIEQQVEKCREKVASGDYAGAITNARTMVEAVLLAIDEKLAEAPEPYGGDLLKLYRRVQRQLNLSPGAEGLADPLRQVLSGLTSVVQGLSSLRNTGSDAHATRYRPDEHHARVAVNAAMTMTDFVLATYEYQSRKGLLPG